MLRRTIRLARAQGVAVGAHPGFPDLVGFGRRELQVTPREAEDFVLYQVAAVAGVAAAEGVALQHVKPHGALYNMAVRDAALAAAIARSGGGIRPVADSLWPAGLRAAEAGRDAGLRVAAEVFADRAYEPDGSLRPRAKPGAVIHDPAAVVRRAVRMVQKRVRRGVRRHHRAAGSRHHLRSWRHARRRRAAPSLRAGLEAAGITVAAIGSP